jgi:hypothetical protein
MEWDPELAVMRDSVQEEVAHAAFNMEQQERRELAVTDDDDDDDDDWSVPDPEEKAAEQRAILVSFETVKKAEDDANEALQQLL